MALTKVGKEGITGIDNSSDATAITIDSSERVMIGTTTEGVAGADELTVGNTSAGNGITIRSGTSNSGALYFSDGTSGASEYDGGFEYSHGSQFMRFISAGSEQARMTTDGLDFRNSTGTKYVLFKNGDGIHFGATAGGNATSTVLDDYEEGSFTPTIGGSSGNGSLSYSTQAGTYTKIGRAVNFNLVVIASSGVSGGGGTLQIDGLPYSARAASSGQVYGWYGNASIGYFFNLSSYGTATQSIKLLGPAAGNTYLRFHSFTNQGDASAPPTQANIQGSSAFYVGGSYEVD